VANDVHYLGDHKSIVVLGSGKARLFGIWPPVDTMTPCGFSSSRISITRSNVSSSDINEFVDEVGFPVLVRPSYVLSGAAMNVCSNQEACSQYVNVLGIQTQGKVIRNLATGRYDDTVRIFQVLRASTMPKTVKSSLQCSTVSV